MSLFEGEMNIEKAGVLLCFAFVIIGVVIFIWKGGMLNGIIG